jgi:hypothetical protein
VGASPTVTFTAIIGFGDTMAQGDTFVVDFNNSFFELPKSSAVSAIFNVNPVGTAYFFSAEVVVYPAIRKAHFIVPKDKTIYGCACTVQIVASGFRHAAYLPASTYDMFMEIYKA